MSQTTTFDELETGLYETAAATFHANASVKKNATIFSLAKDLWALNSKFQKLIAAFDDLENSDLS